MSEEPARGEGNSPARAGEAARALISSTNSPFPVPINPDSHCEDFYATRLHERDHCCVEAMQGLSQPDLASLRETLPEPHASDRICDSCARALTARRQRSIERAFLCSQQQTCPDGCEPLLSYSLRCP